MNINSMLHIGIDEQSFEEFAPYEEALKERLDDYGLLHSRGVALTARMLANLYGADTREAFLGGLLHDWDRCVPNDILVLEADEFGIALDEVLLANPHLLHAHTGALAAQRFFAEYEPTGPLPDSVVNSIAHHTVGSVSMSELDMIVYIADMIEPSRSFPKADMLREMVGTISLKALFLQCYQCTMEFLVKHRRLIHPDTFRVWNHYIAEENNPVHRGVMQP